MKNAPADDATAKAGSRKKAKRTSGNGSSARRPRRKGPAVAVILEDDLYLTGESERAIYNRLSRLEGQVRGVKKMLAEHKSCDDMLVQVSALKQAVNGIAAELLQAHMETCVLGRVEAGEGQQALASLRDAFARVMKHG